MKEVKIGVLREGKTPPDKRVPLLPHQCREVMDKWPNVQVFVQPSDIRCVHNREYTSEGIPLKEDLSDCDILLGVKEVPMHLLIPGKTYLFFSHTLKKQPQNQKLLQTVLQQDIRLIDYECLTEKGGNRIIAFGRFAGIVGAYNAFLLYGKRFQLFDLDRAFQCGELAELYEEMEKIKLPPIKIILTGSGRVSKGSEEVLSALNIRKVSVQEYLEKEFDEAVYVQLSSADYYEKKDGKPFDRKDFHQHPQNYQSSFKKFLDKTDMLIAGAYWDPAAPVLFTKEDMKDPGFRIKVIADITCDIDGSIPSTIKSCSILEPAYDYNPETGLMEAPFSDDNNVTVMAVDNLPGELPRDASKEFGNQLINNVLPLLLGEDKDQTIARGTIADHGKLTPGFSYLSDYAGL
ncbi:NAD(P)-dependent oxidoreductase [Cytophagaceae bacterium ABcell3]|nr:NAD(P)-dependent oxidoreductase [Cytophagaceae bacterium ABcell3]